MLLVLILVAWYSSCFLFYFKHSAIYVPLRLKLEKRKKKVGGGRENPSQSPPNSACDYFQSPRMTWQLLFLADGPY